MQAWLQHLNELEMSVCRLWTRSGQRFWIRRPFALISRLGDGVFWYSLMAALPLVYGLNGLQASLHMMATGGVALLLYKSLKGLTRRARPCHHSHDIMALVPPLDQYSFPSGHTLHAVTFSTVAIYYIPELAWILVPFSTLIALSRIILGLHYPSDVLMATVIGLGLAYLSISAIM
ncbi:phosphatase PAP2 family protein [Allochromatium palmeri]|uniref:undecaprenyl-diphosphate phosphatase n=1 Tax=Allochromatium palmeri TaxID=231048 RepID=A0A6N8EEE9_9GAMM|nr:phosphatase PAP2 family protein [Allochromatium palmeri]MTW22021.1 phosphatase PAP2 family protein [Allochromatium palmeri]